MAPSVLLGLLCITLASGVTVGLDLDSETYRMAVIESTKKAIPVESEKERVEKSTCISFTTEGRKFDQVPTTYPSPNTLCHYFPYFRSPSNFTSFPPLPEAWISTAQGYSARIQDSIQWTSEELLSMLFEHIHKSLSDRLKSQSLEFAISIPSYWTRAQRQTISQCAELAGMKVAGIIHRNTATALHYGYSRFDNETAHWAVILAINRDDLEVSVAKFNATTKKTQKAKNVESVEIVGNAWNLDVSGHNIDREIAENIGQSFQRKHETAVLLSPAHIHRLVLLARAAKTVLVKKDTFKATETQFYAGKDLAEVFKYSDLMQVYMNYRESIIKTLTTALERADITKDQVDSLILVGSDSRHTSIQDLLQDYFHPEIPITLLDEASRAYGVAIFASNASESMQIKPVWLADSLPEEVRVSFLGEDGFNRSLVLFPPNTKFNSKRQLTFTHDKSVICRLSEGGKQPFLVVEMSGVEEFARKYEKKPSQVFTFLQDSSGISFLKWAEARTEVEVPEELNKTETNKEASEASESPSKPPESLPEANQTAVNVTMKRKPVAVSLTLNPREMDLPGPLTAAELKAISIRLSAYRSQDHDVGLKAEAKAKMVEVIGSLKEVFRDKIFRRVTTDQERSDLSDALVETENWLKSEELLKVDSWTVTERTRKLQSIFKEALDRSEELRSRPSAIREGLTTIASLNGTMSNLNLTKTWVPQKDKDEVFERLREVKEWLERVERDHMERSPTEPPLVKVAQIQSKVLGAGKNVERIQKTPRPKQPLIKEKKPKADSSPEEVPKASEAPPQPEATKATDWTECEGEECVDGSIPRTEL